MICCVEEIAYRMGYIGAEDVARIAAPMRRNSYGDYLLRMLSRTVVRTGPRMNVTPTATLPDVLIIDPRVLATTAASSSRPITRARYRAAGIDVAFVQDNHSRSVRGTLRGLHWQVAARPGQADSRPRSARSSTWRWTSAKGSPTFGHWVGVTLSAENFRQLFIPVGFAHGFRVTSAFADIEYKCSDVYDPRPNAG